MKIDKKIIVGLIICNTFISILVGVFVYSRLPQKPTSNELISEFYAVENAVHVSPHSLRKAMNAGEQPYTIVDLRSQQEYEKEHIIGAISIPAYSDPDTSAYKDVDRIVNAFRALPKNKDIIVYCYSTACMTGRKVGQMLVEHEIYVKHLGIGWNEWRYYWNTWNHEHEWNITKVEDYIATGKEPGAPKKKEQNSAIPCSLDNNFGC